MMEENIVFSRSFEMPFESSFDWPTALTELIIDFASEAAVEILEKYNVDSTDAEWKDDEGILDFALTEGIIEKINALILAKSQERRF